eukprot:1160192-Amphidinium_carterae.1
MVSHRWPTIGASQTRLTETADGPVADDMQQSEGGADGLARRSATTGQRRPTDYQSGQTQSSLPLGTRLCCHVKRDF